MDEAGCGFDDSCGFRVKLSYDQFWPCKAYNVSLVVKSFNFVYCHQPKAISRTFHTKIAGVWNKLYNKLDFRFFTFAHFLEPGQVNGMAFENTAQKYTTAIIRWTPPDVTSCISKYV
jgi:hypothetical protein